MQRVETYLFMSVNKFHFNLATRPIGLDYTHIAYLHQRNITVTLI
ncbi:hypothetical protein SLEP1_g35746 [Rubroshorea leprosula]|uniref:Uncharacterized protein n=1 Tax=Rubroshorea leprosula TaxID=152421 RepID=A0AAV5KPP5_9ROSI|nr:hypothetical protein SLEP1_g35746 [Rubroshorea leprosula]